MPSTRDLAPTMMLAMTLAMTFAVAAVVYLVTRAPDLSAGPDQGDLRPGIAACDSSSPATAACPPGYYCRFDACVPVEAEALCGEGDSCRDCECDDGLLCHRNRCVAQAVFDWTPLVCEKNRPLAEAVQRLALECANRKRSVGDIVSTGSCTPADWEQIALRDEEFDLLLSAFPDRFAVHFPSGQPHPRRKGWPAPKVHGHYLEQVRRFARPLRDAKQIFVIGRASPDGDAKSNHWLALARIKFVENLLDLVLNEGIPETERDQHRVLIRSFALPTTRTIDPARYQDTYLMDPGGRPPRHDPILTADEASGRQLRADLNGAVDLRDRTTPAWQALFSAVNRVVFVIPIPCLGNEYKRPITVDPMEPSR